MKKLLIILFLASSLPALAQWRTTSPKAGEITDITFTEDSVGYALSRGGAFGICYYGYSLHKTIDGGTNWVRLKTGVTAQMVALHFINSLVGWIVGPGSKVLKTTDGGMTWIEQTSGVGSGYNDIWFTDANNGFVLGNNGMLRKSTNGGASWTTIYSGTSTNLLRIFFYDNMLGFIGCADGTLLKTTNGGTTWTSSSFGAARIKDVVFTSSTTGYAIGFAGGAEYIWKTTDGGTTWESEPLPILSKKIVFPDENTGYILGVEAGLLKTTDAGDTWTAQYPTDSYSYIGAAMHFVNANYGFVTGKRALIARTFDGGATWENVNTDIIGEALTVSLPHKDTTYIGNAAGQVFKTTNGGVSYSDKSPPELDRVNKLLFLNPRVGFAAGNNGIITKTNDGGLTWLPGETDSTETITDLSFVDDQTGYASAFGGLVFKTQDAGLSWTTMPTGFPEVDFNSIWFVNADTGFVTGNNSGANIYRTLDGGSSWTSHNAGPYGYLNDIVFTNDSVGYCVKYQYTLKTEDTGTTWEEQANPLSFINELFMYNDSSGYATYSTSQASTIDSCQSFQSASTACFASNYTMRAIHGTMDGNYAYAVGMDALVNQLDPNEITKVQVTGNAYCTGSTIFVAFFGRGYWSDPSNTFTAQLSDATGSFDNPVTIGTYPAASSVYGSGVITATVPTGISGGQYRIRVVASSPEIIGPDNGQDIIIQNSITPTLSIADNLSAPLCQGEPLNLSAEISGGGLSATLQWTLNGDPVGMDNASFLTDSLSDGDLIEVSMISSLTCANPSIATAVYEVAYSPEIVTGLVSDTSVCFNSQLSLNANPEYTYNWTPTEGLDNPTLANPVISITENTTYYLEVTDTSGCMAMDSVEISVLELPELFTADTIVCQGTLIQLEASPGGTYTWSPAVGLNDVNVSNPIATVTESVNYQLTATGSNGCSIIDSVYLEAFPAPIITLLADTILCQGDCIEFSPSVNTEIESLEWSPGAELSDSTMINPIFCPTQNETFTLKITDLNGCETSAITTVNLNPLPEVPVVSFDGASLITDASSSGYQWYFNGEVIHGAINQEYIPTQNGVYTVLITNVEGCSTVSDEYDLNNVGITENGLSGIAVYPNPATDLLYINHGARLSGLSFAIYSVEGKQLIESVFDNETKAVDIRSLPAGIYVLRVFGEDGGAVRFVKM